MRNLNRKGGKTDKKWFGPYTIVTIHDNELYSLKKKSDGKVLARRVHGNRLKFFHERHAHKIIEIEDTSQLENEANEVELSQNECNVAEKVGKKVTTGDENANEESNTSMVVPEGSSSDGGHVVKEVIIPPCANSVILEQLYSPYILRLWRTGAAEFGNSPNEDEDFDVSYINTYTVYYYCDLTFILFFFP